jgi:hypothetical protein
MAASLRNVRFTPKSGHQFSALGCPPCAKSRHSNPSGDDGAHGTFGAIKRAPMELTMSQSFDEAD